MKRYGLFALGAIVLVLNVAAGAADIAPRLLDDAACQALKKSLDPAIADRAFEEPPELMPVAQSWRLPIKGVSVPIPPGSYPVHERTVNRATGRFASVLRRSDGLSVALTLEPMPTVSDAFNKAGLLPRHMHPGGVGAEETYALYGSAPTLLTLETDEFTTKSADLDCTDPAVLKRERAALALALKSAPSSWSNSSLRVIGGAAAPSFWGISRLGRYGLPAQPAFDRALLLDGYLLRVRYVAPSDAILETVYKGDWSVSSGTDAPTPPWVPEMAGALLDYLHTVPVSNTPLPSK